MAIASFNRISPTHLGERLASARKARGLTQQDAAEKLQISRPTFVALEKGERKVTAKELVILADLYGRPISEFLRDGPIAPDFVPQFRTAWGAEFPDENEVGRVAAHLQQCAAAYVELEAMTSSPLSQNYPPSVEVAESHLGADALGEDLAVRERNRLGLGDSPISDLHLLLEADVGLRIFFFKMPSQMAGIFGFNESYGGCIGVNNQHPYARQMWSLSHEYGHFLTSRYQSDISFLNVRKGKSSLEKVADSFAKHFLMPAQGVNRRINEVFKQKGNLSILDICTIADVFRVSVQAFLIRLEELGRIRRGTGDALAEQGFQSTQAANELGLSRPRILECFSFRYKSLAVAAFRQGALSEGQLASKLEKTRLEARQLVQEYSLSIELEDGFREVPLDPARVIS